MRWKCTTKKKAMPRKDVGDRETPPQRRCLRMTATPVHRAPFPYAATESGAMNRAQRDLVERTRSGRAPPLSTQSPAWMTQTAQADDDGKADDDDGKADDRAGVIDLTISNDEDEGVQMVVMSVGADEEEKESEDKFGTTNDGEVLVMPGRVHFVNNRTEVIVNRRGRQMRLLGRERTRLARKLARGAGLRPRTTVRRR